MKNFLKGAAVLLALLLAAILLADAYLARPVVDYTLRRGTKDDPQSRRRLRRHLPLPQQI